jgi:ribosomal small subunit protein bTHX
MGKGDKKTRRGKIIKGTYGVRRRRKQHAKHLAAVQASKKDTIKKVADKTETVKKQVIETEEPVVVTPKPETKPKEAAIVEVEQKVELVEKTDKPVKKVKTKETAKSKKADETEKLKENKKTEKEKSPAKSKAKTTKTEPAKKKSAKK